MASLIAIVAILIGVGLVMYKNPELVKKMGAGISKIIQRFKKQQ